MTGTYEGEVDATTGTSVLTLDGDLISRTQVYRYVRFSRCSARRLWRKKNETSK